MKETPIEKIYEAWTAVADGNRLTIAPDSTPETGNATLASSDGKKSYKISWRDGGRTFVSSDPATFWQGYAGYPVVTVLMALGAIPYDEPMARQFAGINWTELNARHKRDYAAALAEVEKERGIDPVKASKAAEEVMAALKQLGLTLKRK